MKQIIKIFMIALLAYLIYVFVFSIIILAFKKPNEKEKSEKFSSNLQNKGKKDRDRVQLMESAKDGAIVRINLIENAEKSIDISYYTLRNGKFTRIMLGSILDAADRGVKVRILLDSLSILPSLMIKFKYTLYALGSHQNIKLKFYGPINPLLPFDWNKRLHNKVFIVDDNLALIGGRNIADNYYLKDIRGKKFSKDRDVIIFKDESLVDYDSVINDIKKYFEKTWNYKYSKPFKNKLSSRQIIKSNLANEKTKLEYMKMKNNYKEKPNKINWYENTIATERVKFVHNPIGTIYQDPSCLRELLILSSQSKKSIFMQSPYFIPSKRIRSNFDQYDIDLEKTTILTNSYHSSPNLVAISAYSNHRKKILENNATIYEYQGKNSIHSKTYIFDDHISVVGSFNLDARSSYINCETMIVIDSKEFTDKLKKNVQIDLDKSLKVGMDYSYLQDENIDKGNVSKIRKIGISIISKITPILEHLL